MKNSLKVKSTTPTSSSVKRSNKSNERLTNLFLEVPSQNSNKLMNRLIREKNGKQYRAVLLDSNSLSSHVFDTINSNYKNKNILISPQKISKSRSRSFKNSSIDLKPGAFSLKQSVLRANSSSTRKSFIKSKNWRSEVKSPSPGSAFTYVPVFHSSLATQQDTFDCEEEKGRREVLSSWQRLMREIDKE